jgi:cullin 1
MADVLAAFCDRILRAGGEKLSDSDAEEYLEKTVQLFSYLTDKDVFADIYRNQLAKRILNQRSNSDDMERLMVGKLKLRCGSQFTGKMEGMLNDLAMAGEHNEQFLAHFKDVEEAASGSAPTINFSVNVLTTGHWPSYRVVDIALPAPMANCTKIFREYYHSTRRLKWTYSLGNATVKGTFGTASGGRARSYDFQVVTLQAAVMLVFNASDTWSFEALLTELKCPEEILKKVIHSLACGKLRVLKKSPIEGNVIRSTDSFSFNDAFT